MARNTSGWRRRACFSAARCRRAAHHSFAIFDHTQTYTLKGTVLSFQWTNPHGYIELDVAEGPKGVDHYTVELTSINMLRRAGWKSSDVHAGDEVTADRRAALERRPWRLAARAQGARRPDARAAGAGDQHLQRRRREHAGAARLVLAGVATVVMSPSVMAAAASRKPRRRRISRALGSAIEVRPATRESAAGGAAAAQRRACSWSGRSAAPPQREADARGEPLASNVTHCIPDGVPSMMNGPFPFEILQNATQINIAQEAYSQIRRIYLDKPQLTLDDIELGFYGRSVGEWQGDTLVVDTIGIKEYVRFRDVPHTRDMRITERFKLVRPDILWDEITIRIRPCSRSRGP